MKLFLLYLTLVTCGSAYYEYTWQQQTAVGFPLQIQALQTKVDTLAAANKKLHDDTAYLNEQLAAAVRQQQMVNLVKTPAALPPGDRPATSNAQFVNIEHGVPLAQPLALGTITTLLGKTYQDCQLLKAGIDDITVSSADGITQIPLNYLPPDLQKRLGYDPQKAEALRQAELRYQEELHQSNGPPPGP